MKTVVSREEVTIILTGKHDKPVECYAFTIYTVYRRFGGFMESYAS